MRNYIKKCGLYILTSIFSVMPYFLPAYSVKEDINIPIEDIIVPAEMEASLHTFYLKENENDGVHKVVIDAGHGGHDPGCQGAHSKEKDIALKIALQLGAELNKSSQEIEVIYTRKKDVFIPLHKRIALANKMKADIFISIHCNYVGNPKVCGTETFVMGLHRAEENLQVAKRENSVVLMEEDFEAHYEGYDPNSPVGHILLSMFQNLHLNRSILLASNIEDKLESRKNQKSRGVKQAGFVVLRQATMPSILVESGFLSNAKEEKYLMSKTGQNEIAKAINSSVLEYFNVKSENSQKSTVKKTAISKADVNYTIQIGVFSSDKKRKLIDLCAFAGDVRITAIGDVYRYTVGTYKSDTDAKGALRELKKVGLKDAFIKTLP